MGGNTKVPPAVGSGRAPVNPNPSASNSAGNSQQPLPPMAPKASKARSSGYNACGDFRGGMTRGIYCVNESGISISANFAHVPTGTCVGEKTLAVTMDPATIRNGTEYHCIVAGLQQRGIDLDKQGVFYLDATEGNKSNYTPAEIALKNGHLCFNPKSLQTNKSIFENHMDVFEACLKDDEGEVDEARVELFKEFFKSKSAANEPTFFESFWKHGMPIGLAFVVAGAMLTGTYTVFSSIFKMVTGKSLLEAVVHKMMKGNGKGPKGGDGPDKSDDDKKDPPSPPPPPVPDPKSAPKSSPSDDSTSVAYEAAKFAAAYAFKRASEMKHFALDTTEGNVALGAAIGLGVLATAPVSIPMLTLYGGSAAMFSLVDMNVINDAMGPGDNTA